MRKANRRVTAENGGGSFRAAVWIGIVLYGTVAVWAAGLEVEEGWNALLSNDVTKAEEILTTYVEDHPDDLEALDGLALALWTRGNMPRAAEVWMESAVRGTDRPWWEGYLAALAMPELQTIHPDRRMEFLQKLASVSDLAPHRRSLVQQEILRWSERYCNAREAEKAAKGSGVIRDWWFVVGPFGAYGATDLWQSFPPERNPAADSYPGWIDTVSPRPIPEENPTGKIDFDSLIYPSRGTAYAFTAIESDEEARARLLVESPGDYVVWWDGEPVLTRCLERRDFFTEACVEVSLRKGLTPLLLKSLRRGGGWWARVRLEAVPGSSLPDWRVADYDSGEEGEFLSGLSFLSCSYPGSQWKPDLIEIKAESDREKILSSIYGALVHFRGAEFAAAREVLSPAIETDIAQAHVLLGDLYMREAGRRGESKSRLQREAEAAYRHAAELYPGALGAHIGLTTYFLDRDNIDQAMEYVESVETELKDERIEYRAGIDYALALLYHRKGWNDECLSFLNRSAEELAPSPEVFRWIARLQADWNNRAGSIETLERGLDLLPHHTGMVDDAISRLHGESLSKDLKSILEKRIAIQPYDMNEHLRLARAWRFSGEPGKARKVCEELIELYPDRPEPLSELAAVKAAEESSELPQDAVELYREILQIAPYDDQARKALRYAGLSEDELIERYDVHLDDLDLSQADRWNESRAPDIYLIDVMVMIIDRQGTHRQYIHQAVKVLNKEGREKWAETVIPKGGNVEIRLARSILPDGTEWPVQHVADLRDQQALSMYGLEDGTIIEYAYLKSVSGNLYPGGNSFTGGYYFGAVDEPMLVSKLAVILPEDMEYLLEVKPEDFGTREQLDDGRIALIWENRLEDGVRQESFMPPVAKVVPSLRMSTWTDWRLGLERWHSGFLGRIEEGPALEEIVQLFSDKKRTKRELVREVYDWIQKEIEPAHGSHTTLDTATLRAGGTWEKIFLADYLLERLGFSSCPAVVVENKPDDGFSPLPVAGFSGLPLLRVDMVSFVRESNSRTSSQESSSARPGVGLLDEQQNAIWLDFNSRYIAAGEVDGENRGGIALVLAEEGEYFEPVDPKVWPRGWIERHIEIQPKKDRSAAVNGLYSYRGTHRRSLLSLIADKEAERRFKDSQVSGDLRGIRLESTELGEVDDPYGTPQLAFSGNIPDFLQPGEGDALRMPAVPVRLEASRLVSEVTRETPVEFDRPPVTEPFEIRVKLKFALEEGYNLVDIPEDYIRLSPYGYYSLIYRRQDDEIIVTRSALIPSQTIETEDYGDFAAFCRGIDEAERRDIILRRGPSSP